jgi:hypothetical protein
MYPVKNPYPDVQNVENSLDGKGKNLVKIEL